MVTSNVDAVYDGDVGNHARFASHDVVYLIFSVSIRASPCPSPSCFLLKLCVHDLEIMSLHLSEMSLAHILLTIFSWYLSVMRSTSSVTLEFPEDTLVILSFHFLFTRKPTHACPLLAS